MLRAGRRAGWARQAHAVPKTHLSVRGGGILLLVCLDYPLRQREQARFFGQVRHGCVVLCSLCLQWHEGRGAGGEWLASAGTARAAHPCPLGCLPEPGDARGGGASSDGQPPGAVCRPASRAWASRRLGRGRVHGQPRVLGTVAGPVCAGARPVRGWPNEAGAWGRAYPRRGRVFGVLCRSWSLGEE